MLTFLHLKLKSFFSYLFSHRQPLILVGLFVAVLGCGIFFVAKPAHAVEVSWNGLGDALIRAASMIFLAMARFFLKVALFFLEYIIIIAGYNGYLSSTAVNVGWSAVLNLTNMFFVVILLVIAFATILGVDQYEWKKLLPKFFFAAILVNFSRTICGVLIDASQVVITAFVNAIAATVGGSVINGFQLDKIEKFNTAVSPGDILSPGIFTATLAAVFFSIMVMSVFGAYLAILAGRLIRLWVLIVLSPLAFVLSVLPKTKRFADDWWSELGDDLVTGPVLLFFIWLSMATIGSGQVNSEILAKSNVPATNKASMDATLYYPGFINTASTSEKVEQSAGLTDILGWNNMANFVIAIGMLIVGAKAASKIGGSSGNLMAGAVGWGKKVATIATGVAAGQWAYGKVSSSVKGAVGKVGDQLAKPFVRLKKEGGNLIRAGVAATNTKRNELAAKLEGAKGFAKPFGWLGARLIESEGRKEDRVSDSAGLADELEKVEKANFKNQTSMVSTAKLNARELARNEEEKQRAKRDQKFTDEQAKMEGVAQKIEETKNDLIKQNTGLDKYSQVDVEKELRKTFGADQMRYYESRKTIIESGAKTQIARGGLDLDRAEFDAEAKAAVLEQNQLFLQADAVRKAAANMRFEKSQEPYRSLNYNERKAQEEILITKIAALQPDAQNNEEARKTIRKLQQQRIALAASNTALDPETSRDTRLHALDKLGFFAQEREINDENRHRAELSRQLGRYVGKNEDMSKVMAEWNGVFDNEKDRQAALRGLSGAFKNAAFKGEETAVGLIKEEITAKGVRLSWNPAPDNSAGTTAYFADKATKVDSVASMGNIAKIGDDFKLNGFSERGIAAVSNFYSGKNTNGVSNLEGSVHSSWNAAHVDPKNAESYVNALLAMEKGMKPDGFVTHLQYTKDFLKKLVDNSGALEQNIQKELTRFVDLSLEKKQGRQNDQTPPPAPTTPSSPAGTTAEQASPPPSQPRTPNQPRSQNQRPRRGRR
jgi:hypothetical protein